ncbi:MAG TPA: hypothetical protein VII11_04705 [Bacteroidota bacterium]
MSTPARSVFIFGLYLAGLGIVLMVAPNFLLGLFGIPETNEVWIRIVGVLVLLLGYYYTNAARKGLTEFFKSTVVARASVIVFFTAFVLLGYAPVTLIVFGAVDLVGAIWTGATLRSAQTH